MDKILEEHYKIVEERLKYDIAREGKSKLCLRIATLTTGKVKE